MHSYVGNCQQNLGESDIIASTYKTSTLGSKACDLQFETPVGVD